MKVKVRKVRKDESEKRETEIPPKRRKRGCHKWVQT